VQLRDQYEQIEALHAEVIAVSTDDLTGAEHAVKQFGAPFHIAYTSGDSAVPRKYGVFNLHGDGLASTSTFIVGKDGQLKWSFIGKRYSEHVAAATIIEQLKAVTN